MHPHAMIDGAPAPHDDHLDATRPDDGAGGAAGLTWDEIDRRFPGGEPAHGEGEKVERAIVIVFVGLRLLMVGQLAISLWFQLGEARIPMPVHLLTVVAMAFSVAYVRDAWRRGSLCSVGWGAADLVVGLVSLTTTSLLVPRDLLVGSWLHWAPGYTEQVAALLSAWLVRLRWNMLGAAVIAATYFALTFPGTDSAAAVLANTGNYLMFTLAASLFSVYVRGLAQASDRNRRLARDSEVARLRAESELEIARYSFLVHGASGLLECFARGEATPTLRRQAAQEAARLRHEGLLPRMSGRPSRPDGRLGDLLDGVLAEFDDLPLRSEPWLGSAAVLPGHQAEALVGALRAVLGNVRHHAHASLVTVHADRDEHTWEVTVVDDGVGFDPDPVRYGFGLANQVVDALCRQGISVQVESERGCGTWVQISGPLA